MYIDSSENEKYIKLLNLRCFPKSVLEFQESQDFFHHIIFIDYQLQLLIQNEFNGLELVPARDFELEGNDSPKQKLEQLITYAHSITANYSETSKSFEESFYYTVVLGQLYYLDSQLDEMHLLLSGFDHSSKKDFDSLHHADFVEYLKVRYNALIGLTKVQDAHLLWLDYLHQYTNYHNKSSVAANHWVDIILQMSVSKMTKNGLIPWTFQDLQNEKFGTNKAAVVTLGNFLLRPENTKFTTELFRPDYTKWLNSEIETRASLKDEFPNASKTVSKDNDFVNTLYETGGRVPHFQRVLPPTLSKKFLINIMSKTYQSQVVLCNYIKTLIELNEYDEALAAFKTYVSYVEKDQEQHSGSIDNILAIIDVYASCILSFNPLNAFVPKTKSPKRFKHTKMTHVMTCLVGFVAKLSSYLDLLTDIADLNYDHHLNHTENILSFLYHKYNVTVLMNDQSEFVRLVSKCWFSLGQYYYYLSTYESATLETLEQNTSQVLQNYKNALIVNSTGNEEYLFNYALALAYTKKLQPASKLAKFILKKYPESFRTWNLLVLILSSFEKFDPDHTKVKDVKELEKFANNALNIAGIFIVNHRKNAIKLTVRTKFEILQLKLTQLAVWEQIYGVQYILDYLPEVFVLYHELFDDVVYEKNEPESSHVKVDEKWSHRPSVLDPAPATDKIQVSKLLKETQLAREKIKNISKHHEEKKVTKDIKDPMQLRLFLLEKKILQDIWLWTSRIYLKLELFEEAEQCIVEAEEIYEPNVKTFTHLGMLTSRSRKFLSLQEFERSLEKFTEPEYLFNKKDYGLALLGLCKLFIIDDEVNNSLFISSKDLNTGLIRLKTLLEQHARSWPYGYNSPELWYYLSIIYEKIDDKVLLASSLWKCVELEDLRPVRAFEVCEEFDCY